MATNLARAGVPPSYVPALTQEYLGAFQHALRQGATIPQADTVASQHLTAVIQQISTPRGGGWATAPSASPASPPSGADVNKEYQRSEQRREQINKILRMP